MADSYAEYYGAVFAAAPLVKEGEVHGPTGTEIVGTLDVMADAVVTIRSTSSTIELFVGELAPVTVPAVDGNGDPITLTGLNLELVIEDRTTLDVITITPIATVVSSFVFTPTTAVTATQRILHWSLRNTDNNAVVTSGILTVSYAANEDVP